MRAGLNGGGDVVNLIGRGFTGTTGASSVQFAGVNAASYSVVHDDLIQATTASYAGVSTDGVANASVTVVTPRGTITKAGWYYLPANLQAWWDADPRYVTLPAGVFTWTGRDGTYVASQTAARSSTFPNTHRYPTAFSGLPCLRSTITGATTLDLATALSGTAGHGFFAEQLRTTTATSGSGWHKLGSVSGNGGFYNTTYLFGADYASTTTPSEKLWAANTSSTYVVGTIVKANTVPFYFQITAVSGTHTSGATEPTWNATIGATTVDNAGANQITWTCLSAVPATSIFNVPHLREIQGAASSYKIFVNGIQTYQDATNVVGWAAADLTEGNANRARLFSSVHGALNGFEGEILHFTSILTTAGRAVVKSYLYNKFGIVGV